MSKEIQQMFSRIAPTYDKANHVLSLKQDMKWREGAVDLLAQDGFTPKRVLDLCAGTGDFTLAVKKRFPEAEVTALDFSSAMLSLARKKTASLKGVQIVTADASSLPFCDMAFDAVVCGFGLRNLDDPTRGLKEMGRVLKPGARAVILEFFRPESSTAKMAHQLYVNTVVPFVGGAISKSPDAYAYLPSSTKQFFSVKETIQRMDGACFKDMKERSFMFGVATALRGTHK